MDNTFILWHYDPVQVISLLGNKVGNGLLCPPDGATLNQILCMFNTHSNVNRHVTTGVFFTPLLN